MAKPGHRKHFLLQEIRIEDEKIAALLKQYEENDSAELRQQYRSKRYKYEELQVKQTCDGATLAAKKAMSGELDSEIEQYKERSPARASSILVYVDGIKRRLR
ncbi:unnamed protein product [Zymoseptoria tritici ST99CH_1A5]|uniref:Uncharacterized protein n=2 Tax=Zymoseptoria tritici TaxID=1047171 RepID=A0A2H1GCQ9_ZYMTR|nr:unnamed protein product [Zymoseptoria tritici ST99CH_1E4]SMR52477.1 unnamed protein product [Zymoseptoria tritici ST99CH_3D1]SMY24022.1 unnamed protein product [Zymoseptoria tritici ST99CH_1A5]